MPQEVGCCLRLHHNGIFSAKACECQVECHAGIVLDELVLVDAEDVIVAVVVEESELAVGLCIGICIVQSRVDHATIEGNHCTAVATDVVCLGVAQICQSLYDSSLLSASDGDCAIAIADCAANSIIIVELLMEETIVVFTCSRQRIEKSTVNFLLYGYRANLGCTVGLNELVGNIYSCQRTIEVPDVLSLVVVARSDNVTNHVVIPVGACCISPTTGGVSFIAGADSVFAVAVLVENLPFPTSTVASRVSKVTRCQVGHVVAQRRIGESLSSAVNTEAYTIVASRGLCDGKATCVVLDACQFSSSGHIIVGAIYRSLDAIDTAVCNGRLRSFVVFSIVLCLRHHTCPCHH